MSDIPKIKQQTSIEMSKGVKYLLDTKIDQEDLNEVHKIWDQARTEVILRIQQETEERIIRYLKDKGYRFVAEEKIKLL